MISNSERDKERDDEGSFRRLKIETVRAELKEVDESSKWYIEEVISHRGKIPAYNRELFEKIQRR